MISLILPLGVVKSEAWGSKGHQKDISETHEKEERALARILALQNSKHEHPPLPNIGSTEKKKDRKTFTLLFTHSLQIVPLVFS